MSKEKQNKTIGNLIDELLSAEISLTFWKLIIIIGLSVVMGFIIK